MIKGITVTERKYINQVEAQAVISFQMLYHDWLKLENSNEWRQVEAKILEIQNRYSQK